MQFLGNVVLLLMSLMNLLIVVQFKLLHDDLLSNRISAQQVCQPMMRLMPFEIIVQSFLTLYFLCDGRWLASLLGLAVFLLNLKQHHRKELYYNVFTANNQAFIRKNRRVVLVKLVYYSGVCLALLQNINHGLAP